MSEKVNEIIMINIAYQRFGLAGKIDPIVVKDHLMLPGADDGAR